MNSDLTSLKTPLRMAAILAGRNLCTDKENISRILPLTY
jgi:hypothetical protein